MVKVLVRTEKEKSIKGAWMQLAALVATSIVGTWESAFRHGTRCGDAQNGTYGVRENRKLVRLYSPPWQQADVVFNITIFSCSFPCIGLEQNLLVTLGGLKQAIFCQLLIDVGFELGLLGWLSVILYSSSLSSRLGPTWTKTVRGLLTRFFLTTGGRSRISPNMDAAGGLGGSTLRIMSLR